MARIVVGMIIGGFVSVAFWFPMGIMYAVQATEPTVLMKIMSVLKGVF